MYDLVLEIRFAVVLLVSILLISAALLCLCPVESCWIFILFHFFCASYHAF